MGFPRESTLICKRYLTNTVILLLSWLSAIYFPGIAHASINLLPNASFEVGSWGWSPVAWVKSELVDGRAPDGNRCLELLSPDQYDKDLSSYRIQSQYVLVEDGKEYSLSFYARSDRNGTALTAAIVGGYQETEKSKPFRLEKQFVLSTVWRRFSIRGVLKLGGEVLVWWNSFGGYREKFGSTPWR